MSFESKLGLTGPSCISQAAPRWPLTRFHLDLCLGVCVSECVYNYTSNADSLMKKRRSEGNQILLTWSLENRSR